MYSNSQVFSTGWTNTVTYFGSMTVAAVYRPKPKDDWILSPARPIPFVAQFSIIARLITKNHKSYHNV